MQPSDPTFARSLGTLSLLLLAASCGDGAAIGDTAEGTTPDSQTSDAGTHAHVMTPATGSAGSVQRGDEVSPRQAEPTVDGDDASTPPSTPSDIVEPPHPDAGAANNSSSPAVWRPFSDASPWTSHRLVR